MGPALGGLRGLWARVIIGREWEGIEGRLFRSSPRKRGPSSLQDRTLGRCFRGDERRVQASLRPSYCARPEKAHSQRYAGPCFFVGRGGSPVFPFLSVPRRGGWRAEEAHALDYSRAARFVFGRARN